MVFNQSILSDNVLAFRVVCLNLALFVNTALSTPTVKNKYFWSQTFMNRTARSVSHWYHTSFCKTRTRLLSDQCYKFNVLHHYCFKLQTTVCILCSDPNHGHQLVIYLFYIYDERYLTLANHAIKTLVSGLVNGSLRISSQALFLSFLRIDWCFKSVYCFRTNQCLQFFLNASHGCIVMVQFNISPKVALS